MRLVLSEVRVYFRIVFVAICALVWCAGAATAAMRPAMRVSPDVASFVYGCASLGNYCNVYSAHSGKLQRTVTENIEEPNGIAVDSAGRWYVADTQLSEVLIFQGGRTHQVGKLDDSGRSPDDVAVARNEVAVSNFNGNNELGTVAVYRHGATTPSELLAYPSAVAGISVTYDIYGNCFWMYTNGSTGDIVEFPKCSSKRAPVDLSLLIGVPGGLASDADDNLWYVDQTAGLFECKGIKRCKLVASGFVDPNLIKFDEHGSDLYLMDAGFGIYRISGINGSRPLKVRPLIEVTPFAQITPSDLPSGVAAGMAV